MKPWDNGALSVSANRRYLTNGDTPFFWLGDTAWLLFVNLTEEEAYIYLKNRAEKGFNVIQAVLAYSVSSLEDVNKMSVSEYDVRTPQYWEHCDRIISMAESLGMYMALLPSWGSLVKKGIINDENAAKYARFLADRYKGRKNIIWLLGGDIRAAGYEELYRSFAEVLKKNLPDRLIGFHPFGRCSSSMWFADFDLLDFNMFQSGHRRYDQCTLGSWDDNDGAEFFGEDNWKYVLRDLKLCNKPTLDGEPSYEGIPQGLHDASQPYWSAKDVRRYAYWSVFAGACGHTYGNNAVMQFYSENRVPSYGAREYWYEAIHHDGSGQMGYLKALMTSVDFTSGSPRDDLLIGGQREKYGRVAVFAGDSFLLAYSFSGEPFELDLSNYIGAEMRWFRPSTGVLSYIGKVDIKHYKVVPPVAAGEDTDTVFAVTL